MPQPGARRLSWPATRPAPEAVADWLLIVATLLYAAIYMLVLGTSQTYSPIGMLAVLAAVGGCLLLSRHRAFPALLLASGLFFPFVHTVDAQANGPNSPDGLLLLTAVIIYRLAATSRVALSAASVVIFVAAQVLAHSLFNIFIIIGTTGPWAIGVAVRTRTQAQHELQERQRELEVEQEQYNQESVRYERTRIARDLHDIVAHNVSLMVVQASAGQILADNDPARTAETFDTIAEVASRAQAEIAVLVPLRSASPSTGASLNIIHELLEGAAASGLAVTYRVTAWADELDTECVLIAYRVVQEGVTNAVKHAFGAPITVVIHQAASHLDIEICNGPSTSNDGAASLAAFGGAHGITGLRERVTQVGGTLHAGATSEHGWRLAAHLPRQI